MRISKEEAKKAIEDLVTQFTEQYDSYNSAQYDEAKLRQHFINKFFIALGWDVTNNDGLAESYCEVIYEDKLKVGKSTKAPDYGFRLSGSFRRLFFVEAKKPAVKIKTNKEAAYQLRRYGRSAQTPVSILTNFEEFAVYDCSKRPTQNDSAAVGRIKYLHYTDYLNEFDFLYDTFSREAVVKGRFDKYVQSDTQKRGSVTLDKEFVESLNIWRKYLAVSIARNNQKLTEEHINFAVQQTIDRLIFLRFCEDRAVEHYGTLKKATDKGDAYKNLLHVFKLADDKYNSGLFDFEKDTITPALKLDNKVIKNIVDELYYPKCEYEFSVMPVEILGNAYEQFLGKVIRITASHSVKIDDKPEVRKAGGVYYTPQYIVDYIVEHTVGELIKGKAPKDIEKIKIVDPACGSGSFLLGAFRYLLKYHNDWYINNGYLEKKDGGKVLTPEGRLNTAEKKKILLNNIFGVDLDSNAVEVSKLSLLLKCMEGETDASINQQLRMFHERVLPDLDKNILCGNSLIGHDFFDSEFGFDSAEKKELEKKIKPFDWKIAFPQVFKQGGFDAVVGNPPYLGGREWKEENGNQYNYFLGKYESIEYQFDMYAVFWERGIKLLKQTGLMGFITPNTWLNNQGTIKLRNYILNHTSIKQIVDYSKVKVFVDAVVLPIVTILQNGKYTKGNVQIFKPDANFKLELKNQISQKIWSDDELKIFHIDLSKGDLILRSKIEHKKSTLESVALVKFGIKIYETGKGTPPQKSSAAQEKIFEANRKVDKTYRPYLEGKDILRYELKYQNRWLKYGENLAAPRDPDLFKGQRLLVRRIVGETLISTFIEDDFVTSQLLQIVKPFDTISAKYLLALLNSKLIAYYFKKKYNRQDKTFPEIRIYELASLPIQIVDLKNKSEKNLHDKIVSHVDTMLDLNKQLPNAATPTEKQQLENRIAYTDKKIDELVYELYDLTEEEIKIVEAG